MTAQVFTIRDWDGMYEVSQSRRLRGKDGLAWVAVPTHTDSRVQRRVMQEPDGLQITGVMDYLVKIAARMPRRGVLADKMGPLGVDDLAIMIGCQVPQLQRAINVLTSPGVGWLVSEEWPLLAAVAPRSEHARSALGACSEHARNTRRTRHDEHDTTDTTRQTYMVVDRTNEADDQEQTTDEGEQCARDAERLAADDGRLRSHAEAVQGKILAALRPHSDADWLIVRQAALAVALGVLSEHAVADAAEAVRRTQNVRRPFGLFIDMLQKACAAAGVPFARLTALAAPPAWRQKQA